MKVASITEAAMSQRWTASCRSTESGLISWPHLPILGDPEARVNPNQEKRAEDVMNKCYLIGSSFKANKTHYYNFNVGMIKFFHDKKFSSYMARSLQPGSQPLGRRPGAGLGTLRSSCLSRGTVVRAGAERSQNRGRAGSARVWLPELGPLESINHLHILQ